MTDKLDRRARALALEEFRQKHLDDLELIYARQFKIATSEKSDDKNAVNAAKNCQALLGVARPAQERAAAGPVAPTCGADSPAPKLDPGVEARINKLIGK